MNLRRRNGMARSLLLNFGALCGGALLFAASFPNPLAAEGFPFFAWGAFAPVFWLVRRTIPASPAAGERRGLLSGYAAAALWGALYGCLSYTLFNYWLAKFHPLAGLAAGVVMALWFALLFPLFRLAAVLFPGRGYIVQWLIWLGWEYLRTLGFLGYPYGIAGYSQWRMIPLIQIAGVFGVWGVSALVVFPSAWLAAAAGGVTGGGAPRLGGSGKAARLWSAGGDAPLLNFFLREGWSAALWFLALAASLVYGFRAPHDFSGADTARVALVQNNLDPWKGGIIQYRRNFEVSRRLSREALAEAPDLVVWSETAFIPRIYWQIHYRDDRDAWSLVQDLLAFLEDAGAPFLIGNDDARKEPPENPENGYRVDYNAALLFNGAEIAGQYRKMRLVPFTEHFPYRDQLPWLYDFLTRQNFHFWKAGTEQVVFGIPLESFRIRGESRPGSGETSPAGPESAESPRRSLRFSTPICFEDSFGRLSRDAVLGGSQMIVNITNDSWARSLVCQMQHLGMAVFRAVENRRSVLRAATSGQTCAIAPDGRIMAMARPFTETWLAVDAPVLDGMTPYTRLGDLAGQFFAALAAALLLAGIIADIMKRLKGAVSAGRSGAGG